MSIPGQTYFNTGLALFETALNVCGSYLPSKIGNQDLSHIHNNSVKVRQYLGVSLAAVGAFAAIAATLTGYFTKDVTGFYKNIAAQSATYVGHGVLNLGRSLVETHNLGALAAIYDAMGQPFLAYNNVMPNLDPARFFALVKDQVGNVSKLIPSVAAKAAAFL